MKATMPHSNSHPDPELLSAYLDEEVGAAERASVQGHLAGCERCRHELESLHWTANLFHQLPPIEPPRNFYVTEAMLAPEPTPSLWERLMQQWRPLLGGLSASAAALLMVLLLQTPIGGPQMASDGASAPEAAMAVPAAEQPVEQSRMAEIAVAPEEAETEMEAAQDEAAGLATEAPSAADASEAAEPAADESAAEESAVLSAPAESPPAPAQATEVAVATPQAEEEAMESAAEAAPPPTTVAVDATTSDSAAPPTVAPEELPVAAEQAESESVPAPAPSPLPRLLGWAMVVMLLLLAATLLFWRR